MATRKKAQAIKPKPIDVSFRFFPATDFQGKVWSGALHDTLKLIEKLAKESHKGNRVRITMLADFHD